jgi:hypothetical protein
LIQIRENASYRYICKRSARGLQELSNDKIGEGTTLESIEDSGYKWGINALAAELGSRPKLPKDTADRGAQTWPCPRI